MQKSPEPATHPALLLIAIAARETAPVEYDVAREHDRALDEGERDGWQEIASG